MRRLKPLDALTAALLVAAVLLTLADRTHLATRLKGALAAAAQERAIARHWSSVATSATPIWFPSDSGPTIIEVFQYTCQGCIESAPEVRAATRGRSRLALIHVPTPTDSIAVRGAAMVICAGHEGDAGVLHDSLVSTTNWYALPDSAIVGSVLGAPSAARVLECIDSGEWREQLAEHRRLAGLLRVEFTPFFFGQSGAAPPTDVGLTDLVRNASLN